VGSVGLLRRLSFGRPDVKAARSDLLGVQALRAVAAFLVVGYHAVEQWTTHVPGYGPHDYWPNGSAGVDIFFVISGLVMTLSVRRHAGRDWPAWGFARDRIIRIVPLYWSVTFAKILAVLALPGLVTRTHLGFVYVLGSLAFWPVRDITGVIRPVLPVGWTLSYEMFFYLLIAVALACGVTFWKICIPALTAVALIAVLEPVPGFANTIVLEFLFGIVIGMAVPRLQTVPVTVSLPLGLIGLGFLLVGPVISGVLRPVTWGLPAACLVACTVAAEATVRRWLPRWLLAAGNASYATYLTHGFVIPVVFLLCIRSTAVDWVGLTLTIILGLLISAVVGQVTHHFFEQPLLFRLRPRRTVSEFAAPG
jgi:exopolysaccharide production protein ExoZ